VEGQTIAVEYRFSGGNPDRLSELADTLVRLGPDILWTHSPAAAQAAKQATTTIPIVVGVSSDLVEHGLAESLPRPGSNLTGMELRDVELTGKRLELLKEAIPMITRVAVLVDPTDRSHNRVPGNIEVEARALGVQLQRVEAGVPEAFENVFAAIMQGGADALMIMDVPVFARNRQQLLELARLHRLPTISGWRIFAEAGSLLAYGANVYDLCRRSVVYVDKILKGAKPANLPIQRADKFELLVNLKTAQALGLTLPPVLLLRADEVLE
jgi:putative ABC transport system substrate-binding protein